MNRNLTLSRDVHIAVCLSKLVTSRRNPRRVKPERDAHRRLVASVKAHGLLAPLVVQAGDDGQYRVIAGNRRLAALREAYKDADKPPKIPCVLRAVDDQAADALALAENFVREPMHPLDEAEAFARLVRDEAKTADAVAAEFGVGAAYVRQRMKLATLADPVKAAYRQGTIDTATAEAFASVPADRQLEVWQETGGNPQHAHHVRNIIAHAWVEAKHALFDVATLPDGAVSRDLFADRVLVERRAFMEAQADALLAERAALADDGWAEIVVGPQSDVQDRLWSMVEAPHEYDAETTAKLDKLQKKRDRAEAKIEDVGEDDQAAFDAIQTKLDVIDEEERLLIDAATAQYAEATKAAGTAFLILDPDGRVRREYRQPRRTIGGTAAAAGRIGAGDSGGAVTPPPPPTSDELAERQLGTTFTHQALAVREALLGNASARKRVLALILHDKVRSEALAVRRDANGTTLHADHAEGFASPALANLRERRNGLDPLAGAYSVDDHTAYAKFARIPESDLDALIGLLTVETVTAHLQRRTELVWHLAEELGVQVRRQWTPDADWLAGFKKIQLAHLIGVLRGPVYATAAERKKKSELVADLAGLFADAAAGRVEDAALAARVNDWLPSNLRPTPEPEEMPGPHEAEGLTADAA